MADSSLQDIICCIGHPVSANPTQYVLERATAATALDCRCLTLDVAPDQLERAVNGMRAMGFCGAIVAAPHPTEAGKYLDETRGAAGREYVDLIYRDNGGLVGEATVGRAILALVRQSNAYAQDEPTNAGEEAEEQPTSLPKTALVLGDDARAMAIAAEFVAAGIRTSVVTHDEAGKAPSNDQSHADGPSKPPEPPVDPPADDSTDSTMSGAQPASATATQTSDSSEIEIEAQAADEQPQPELDVGIRYLTREEFMVGKVGAELVVQARTPSGESIIDLSSPELMTVAVDLTTESDHTDLLRAAAAHGCDTINSVAVQLQMLIMAFECWTGVQPDEQIMRDALEEFLLV